MIKSRTLILIVLGSFFVVSVKSYATTLSPERIEDSDFRRDSQFQDQSGKTVTNYGPEPVRVHVVKTDGTEETIKVPPGHGVALPPGVRRVESVKEPERARDGSVVTPGATEHSQIFVEGDKKEVPVKNDNPVTLDPRRPGVTTPTRINIHSEDYSPHDLRNQEGKRVTNYGDRPVRVNAVDENGNVIETIEVKPGESVALPPGTAGVGGAKKERVRERGEDGETIDRELPGFDPNQHIVIEGDKNSSDVKPDNPVALDPNRPEVVRPTRVKIYGNDGYHPRELERDDGKSVTNEGSKPVSINVYGPNGEKISEIEVQPGENVKLPPGASRVEAETETQLDRKGNVIREGADKNSRIMVHGDGNEVPVEIGNSVSVDPARKDVARPTRIKIRGGEYDNDTFERDGGKSVTNRGNRSVRVDVFGPGGEKIGEIEIQPGENVMLPPGVVRVEGRKEDTLDHKGNVITPRMDENSEIFIEGDGQSTSLSRPPDDKVPYDADENSAFDSFDQVGSFGGTTGGGPGSNVSARDMSPGNMSPQAGGMGGGGHKHIFVGGKMTDG